MPYIDDVRLPNVLLFGPVGSGKTFSLRTIVDAGLELFVIQTEPSEVLSDLPKDRVHWHYIAPTQVGWDTLRDKAKKINTMSPDALSKLVDINRSKYQQWMEFIDTCNDFVDDRTGERYGDVMTWDTSRALVIDSLTGLNKMVMALQVGGKPTKEWRDWQIAQDTLEEALDNLTGGTKCLFVLTAHAERETDEVSGGIQVMVSTLGKKLAPRLPRFFSDVVYTKKEVDRFFWSTASPGVDTKQRNLPLGDKLLPSFVPLLETWKQRAAKGNQET